MLPATHLRREFLLVKSSRRGRLATRREPPRHGLGTGSYSQSFCWARDKVLRGETLREPRKPPPPPPSFPTSFGGVLLPSKPRPSAAPQPSRSQRWVGARASHVGAAGGAAGGAGGGGPSRGGAVARPGSKYPDASWHRPQFPAAPHTGRVSAPRGTRLFLRRGSRQPQLRASWRWARSPKAGRRGSATRPHGGSGRPCRPVWPRPSRTPTTSRQSWRPQMRGWSRPKGSR